MNAQEHLLSIIAEECAEVAQRASKALRFGLDEIQPGQSLTNAERVMQEFDDLYAVIVICQDRGLLPGGEHARILAKRAKVFEFLRYSQACGTLQGPL